MVKVNLVGFKQLQTVLEKAPRNIQKEVGAQIQFAAENFRDRAIKDAPDDMSSLRGQITKVSLGELTAEVVSGSKYSAPMEFGTKGKFRPIAGIDASRFKGQPAGGNWKDFVKNMTNWVRRKGIAGTYSIKTRRRTGSKSLQQSQNEQLGYLIARSIYRKGVRPHPFFFKQIAPVRRDLFRNVRNILKDVI